MIKIKKLKKTIVKKNTKGRATPKPKTNPRGANQHKPDPRQFVFFNYYLDPKSKTFSNAFRSAIEAGFSEEYARNLKSLMPTWLSEKLDKISDEQLLHGAEKNLKEFVFMSHEEETVREEKGYVCTECNVRIYDWLVKKCPDCGGDVKKITLASKIKKVNPVLLKVKADTTKFVAETLGKEKYSKKSEVVGHITVEDAMKKNILARREAAEEAKKNNK